MKSIKGVFLLLVVMVSTNYGWAINKTSGEQKTDTEVIVQSNNKFALDLYAKLRAKEGNLFFSPHSISTALAMTYTGARSQTETQMAKVLHFPTVLRGVGCGPNKEPIKHPEFTWESTRVHSAFKTILEDLNARGKKEGCELSIANALWGQKGYGFLKEFLELIKINYNGGFNEVDFAGAVESARITINSWIDKETKGKIKDLIQPRVLNKMTRLVLTNAIYFKGNWARQFKKDKTENAPFTLLNGKRIDVAMMNKTADFNYMETESFQIIGLPYTNNELSMIILLPKEIDGLAGIEETLILKNLSQWLGRFHKCQVMVSVPKFKVISQFSLADTLKSMGMPDAFSEKADFSGMNAKRDLYISAVIHKAYVDVNEEGTEAAAATAAIIGEKSIAPGAIPVFRADHPFLFLIRDNHSGSILFIGRMMNPGT